MRPLDGRIAGAPITWGVSELPDWGHRMPPERVLREAAGLGLAGMELGPRGYLPERPEQLSGLLASHGLRLVAGFVPGVLHRREERDRALAEVEAAAELLAGGSADLLLLAADAGRGDYDGVARLDEEGWEVLAATTEAARGVAEARGVALAFHPHHGTFVESPAQIERFLASCRVPLCLDTGHLLLGGGDPAGLLADAPERVAHVHLKDVDDGVAERVRRGELTYREGVAAGLYRPLGRGDVDVVRILDLLDAAGYEGWYVLEQDAILGEEPPAGEGPVRSAALSLTFLQEAAT